MPNNIIRSSPLSEIRRLETLVINRYIKQSGSDVMNRFPIVVVFKKKVY